MCSGVARWNHTDKTVTYHWNADSQGDISDPNWIRWRLNINGALPDFPDEALVDLRRYVRINGQVLTGCLKTVPSWKISYHSQNPEHTFAPYGAKKMKID